MRFPGKQIERWSSFYADPLEAEVEGGIAPRMRELGYLTKSDFIRLCRWKTPRSRSGVERNAQGFIRATTTTAFSTPDERLRIEVLTLLDGVSWPTASVILHFGHRDPYPILDFRALWSLGIVNPPANYDFDFWWSYTQACRNLARRYSCSMRTLDRALWQYSREKQRRPKAFAAR